MGIDWREFALLDKLQDVREERGLTREALAAMSGVSAGHIAHKEKSAKRIRAKGYDLYSGSAPFVLALAKALNVEMQDIATLNPDWGADQLKRYEARIQKLGEKRKSLEVEIAEVTKEADECRRWRIKGR